MVLSAFTHFALHIKSIYFLVVRAHGESVDVVVTP